MAKNPRFCGVELKPITGPHYVGASVGGSLVRLWSSDTDEGTFWYAQALLPSHVRIETFGDKSRDAALRSLRGKLRGLYSATERMLTRGK